MDYVGGYLNDSGVIDVKRLQVILNEMAEWEQGVFEQEFSDLNWYKGKQSKHVKDLEKKQNQSQRCAFSFPLHSSISLF